MKYEITYKNDKKKILTSRELPIFSSNFNRMLKELKIGESLYDISTMTNVKLIGG